MIRKLKRDVKGETEEVVKQFEGQDRIGEKINLRFRERSSNRSIDSSERGSRDSGCGNRSNSDGGDIGRGGKLIKNNLRNIHKIIFAIALEYIWKKIPKIIEMEDTDQNLNQ
jgi:hypothetical protein